MLSRKKKQKLRHPTSVLSAAYLQAWHKFDQKDNYTICSYLHARLYQAFALYTAKSSAVDSGKDTPSPFVNTYLEKLLKVFRENRKDVTSKSSTFETKAFDELMGVTTHAQLTCTTLAGKYDWVCGAVPLTDKRDLIKTKEPLYDAGAFQEVAWTDILERPESLNSYEKYLGVCKLYTLESAPADPGERAFASKAPYDAVFTHLFCALCGGGDVSSITSFGGAFGSDTNLIGDRVINVSISDVTKLLFDRQALNLDIVPSLERNPNPLLSAGDADNKVWTDALKDVNDYVLHARSFFIKNAMFQRLYEKYQPPFVVLTVERAIRYGKSKVMPVIVPIKIEEIIDLARHFKPEDPGPAPAHRLSAITVRNPHNGEIGIYLTNYHRSVESAEETTSFTFFSQKIGYVDATDAIKQRKRELAYDYPSEEEKIERLKKYARMLTTFSEIQKIVAGKLHSTPASVRLDTIEHAVRQDYDDEIYVNVGEQRIPCPYTNAIMVCYSAYPLKSH